MASWAARQRADFIASRLAQGLPINRGMICAEFECSAATAAGDLTAYRHAHPGAMVYDRERRAYFAAGDAALSRDARLEALAPQMFVLLKRCQPYLQSQALRAEITALRSTVAGGSQPERAANAR